MRAALPADVSAGWALLLPAPRAGARVLCLELNAVRNAEALAYWHEHVTALTLLPDGVSRTEFTAGVAAAEERVAWRAGAPLPYEAGTFDVVACRFLGGTGAPPAAAATPSGAPAALAAECARVAAAAATIYFDLPNPLSYQRIGAWLRGRRADAARPGSTAPVESALRAHGFSPRRQAFTTERGEIADVLPARGYRSTRNSWSRAERVKQLLLGRRGARWFAAAYGVVAQRGVPAPDLLHTLAPGAFDSCFVNPGKSFVRYGASMFVVPADAQVVERRRREVRALQDVAASGLGMAQLIPQVARELDLAGRPVFEFEAIDGATIDAPTADFPRLVETAFALLLRFNRETQRRVTVGEEEFALLAGKACDAARSWYPALAPVVERLRAQLRAALHGCETPVVWLHGDYKLENLIIADRDRSVRAVIDWELGVPLGLPLCDLYYLMCYARVTTGAAGDVLDCVEAQLIDGHWTESERDMLNRYSATLGLDPALTPLAVAAFVLQHVGLRFRCDGAALERLPGVFARIEQLLAAQAPLQPRPAGA